MLISDGAVVSFRYIMFDLHGCVLENSHDKHVLYLHGSSAIHCSLQSQLEGLTAGSQAQLKLTDPTGEYLFKVFIHSVRHASEAEKELGYPVQTKGDCSPGCECINQLS